MPQNFFITGMPKSGKTTLLMTIVRELKARGLRVGGLISPEEKHHGTRTAFYVIDIATGKQGLLASVDGDGPMVSKYHVDVKSFENVAVPALDRSSGYDVMVIDEIGAMELKSGRFRALLDELLESPTPLIASIQLDCVSQYGPYGEVTTLTADNHEQARFALLGRIRETIGPKPKGSVWVRKEKALPVKKGVAKTPGTKKKPGAKKKAGTKTKSGMKKRAAKQSGTAKEPETKNEVVVKKGLLGKLRGLFR